MIEEWRPALPPVFREISGHSKPARDERPRGRLPHYRVSVNEPLTSDIIQRRPDRALPQFANPPATSLDQPLRGAIALACNPPGRVLCRRQILVEARRRDPGPLQVPGGHLW